MSDIVTIYVAKDIFEARLMQQSLQDEGIETQVAGEQLSGSYIGPQFEVSLLTSAELADRARQVVEQIKQSIREQKADE